MYMREPQRGHFFQLRPANLLEQDSGLLGGSCVLRPQLNPEIFGSQESKATAKYKEKRVAQIQPRPIRGNHFFI
jgi:hypothetical protein